MLYNVFIQQIYVMWHRNNVETACCAMAAWTGMQVYHIPVLYMAVMSIQGRNRADVFLQGGRAPTIVINGVVGFLQVTVYK